VSQQINLYNAALAPSRDMLSASHVAGAAAASIVIVAIAAGGFGHVANQREAELAALQPDVKAQQDRLAVLTRDTAPKRNMLLEAELAEANVLLQGREAALRVLAGKAPGYAGGYADTLRAMARQSVAGLWLTQFSIDDASGELNLKGRTLDPAQVPVFVKRLNAETALQGRPIARFSMLDATLARPAGASASAGLPVPPARHFTEFVLGSGKAATGAAQ
jgi:hypothetical protein